MCQGLQVEPIAREVFEGSEGRNNGNSGSKGVG